MPNDPPAKVRKPSGGRARAAGSSRTTDARVVRTTDALGRALVALIEERDFHTITVQQVLDHAGIARSTFYAHYRNKEDVLQDSYERLFSHLEALLDRRAGMGARLFPLREFLEHVATSDGFVASLRRAGRVDELWLLFTDYSARIIERRLPTSGVPNVSRVLSARMLAGALLESTRWWLDHRTSLSPTEMDASFHALAYRMLRPTPA
jgi:AcrR family transcriptional regulator